ncbi:MAG: polyphosphate kinase 1 [Ignavibacteriaceae bacterium]
MKKNNKFFNRELSWLSFNQRVLQEADDKTVPPLERLKFLAIYSNNLDEFFRVRVASIRSLLSLKTKTIEKLPFDPGSLLEQISSKVYKQQEEFGRIFNNGILPELKKNNIYLVDESDVSDEERLFLSGIFDIEILPHIQPVLLVRNRIIHFLKNGGLYLVLRLQTMHVSKNSTRGRSSYALVEIPTDAVGRFIILPSDNKSRKVILLDDVLRLFLPRVFSGYQISEIYSIKLTRDAELYIDDEFTGNLLEKIKKGLTKRKTGLPCRFLYDKKIPPRFLNFLKEVFSLSDSDLIGGGKYHNFNDFFSFPDFGYKQLKYPELPPQPCPGFDTNIPVFESLKEKDILIHYPYQTFDHFIRFLNEAALDQSVTKIKITLYRVAKQSEVIAALKRASLNGKNVVVFVEVKARFDEELNFAFAEELKTAGIKVLYSFPGLKVHAKICLIEREERNVKISYAYFGTGNFNEKTSRVYADTGLFTSDYRLTSEAEYIFDFLSSKTKKVTAQHLLVAPFNLRTGLEKLIDNEINAVKNGGVGKIILKLNSIEDRKMIKKIYKASQAGVKINLVVRGICCIIPGKKGLSENVKARSIVDRFLEHSRIYIFHNNGDEKIYLSSADLMRRNLNRRIEVCFPVFNDELKKEIKQYISCQLKDNVKARKINISQSNPFIKSSSKKKLRAQYSLYEFFRKKAGYPAN